MNFGKKIFTGAYQKLQRLKTKIIKIFIINKSVDKRIKDRKLPFSWTEKTQVCRNSLKFEFPRKYPKIIEK